MEEIYWITRMDGVLTLFYIILAIALALFIVFGIIYVADEFEDKRLLKAVIGSFVVTLFASLVVVFVPSTKDMLMIYGVGGTYEYIKDSDTAKEIPDKCLKAVDKFLDEYIEEDQKKEN